MRRSLRSSSGAAVTNGFAALLAVDAGVGLAAPRRTRRTSSAACGGRRRPRRPPATIRTPGSSRDSTRRAPSRSSPAGDCAEQHALQRVRERADGELGDQPHQIRRQAAMHGAGANRRLIAAQRRRQQRAGFELAAFAVAAGCAWPPRRRRRRPARRTAGTAPASAPGPAAESARRPAPARRASSLAARYFGGSDSLRQPAARRAPRRGRSTQVSSRCWRARAGARSGRVVADDLPALLRPNSSRFSREKA